MGAGAVFRPAGPACVAWLFWTVFGAPPPVPGISGVCWVLGLVLVARLPSTVSGAPPPAPET
eukprot:11207397-Lingulodinium_polyedra.AAC.1